MIDGQVGEMRTMGHSQMLEFQTTTFYVCVYHLNRCKTSHWLLTNLQGVPGMHTGLAPTKTPVCHL